MIQRHSSYPSFIASPKTALGLVLAALFISTTLLPLALAEPVSVPLYSRTAGSEKKSSGFTKNFTTAPKPRIENKTDFGLGWKPTPLVDTTPKPVSTTSTAPTGQPQKAAEVIDPSTEAFLKPMLPFISAVENNLQVKPNHHQSIQGRLNSLQTIVFGEVTYKSPSECLGKLAELFPAEAAKSKQQLLSDMQRKTLSPKTMTTQQGPVFKTEQSKPVVFPSTTTTSKPPIPKRGWGGLTQKNDDFWGGPDPFKNDPFFQNNTAATQPKGSTLKNIGVGLASLVGIAAPVAGSYFLNKSSGNSPQWNPNNPYYGNGYYNTPYGYSAYGYPYYPQQVVPVPGSYPPGSYPYGRPPRITPYRGATTLPYGNSGLTYQTYPVLRYSSY